MGTIKSIRNEHLTFKMDNKQALSLSIKDKSIRHIDHAWASTTHAYQGKTVDHAVVLMPSRHSPLTSLQSLYTGSSRHRLSLTIITDDANKLSSNIEKNLNLEKLEANIRWPEQEALAQKKLELEKQRSEQHIKKDKQKIEL